MDFNELRLRMAQLYNDLCRVVSDPDQELLAPSFDTLDVILQQTAEIFPDNPFLTHLANLVSIRAQDEEPEIRASDALIVVGQFLVAMNPPAAYSARNSSIERRVLIETGRRVLRETSESVILFGSDMSWAGDYQLEIRALHDVGKQVEVLHAPIGTDLEAHNGRTLINAGAKLYRLPFDSGIRGMLADPLVNENAVLFVAHKRRSSLFGQGIEGLPGDNQAQEYSAALYTALDHGSLLRAMTKLYGILKQQAEQWSPD